MSFRDFYDRNYKLLMIIPFLLVFIAIGQIGYQIATTGDFVTKGVSLTGGIEIRVSTSAEDTLALESALQKSFPDVDITVRKITSSGVTEAFIVESTSNVELRDLISEIKNLLGDQAPSLEELAASTSEISSDFSQSFFAQTMKALFFAFVFMGAVVFWYFRKFIPCMAVVLVAISDILITVAALNILDIRLTPGGIAALLMLIGYSVDTDILLSTRVLKQGEGSVTDRIKDAFDTGIIMTTTTITAATVGYFVASSDTIQQIMLILIIGLLADVILTWLQNAGILKWYLEGKSQ